MTLLPLIIWAKALFFFEQLFPVVARTWLESKSDSLFLGPKFRFLAQKSNFCHTTLILVNGPFVALGDTVHFPPWERFFDFPSPCYGHFCKKKLRVKKSFPSPLWGHRLPVTALAPSARRPLGLICQKIVLCRLQNSFDSHVLSTLGYLSQLS